MDTSIARFLIEFEKRHYVINEEGVNIVGWRNAGAQLDKFGDVISVYYKDTLGWKAESYPATTRPGKPNVLNPVNSFGAAIVVPGQYLSAYELGIYKGYTALKQCRPIDVYRDNNRDGCFDTRAVTIQTGLFGIHIHKAGVWSKIVGNSSAGCQVFQKSVDFEDFIDTCFYRQKDVRFTYTLIEQ